MKRLLAVALVFALVSFGLVDAFARGGGGGGRGGGRSSSRSSYGRSTGRVSVRGYYRKDGTYVRPHTRSFPRGRGGGSSSGGSSSGYGADDYFLDGGSSSAARARQKAQEAAQAQQTVDAWNRVLSGESVDKVDKVDQVDTEEAPRADAMDRRPAAKEPEVPTTRPKSLMDFYGPRPYVMPGAEGQTPLHGIVHSVVDGDTVTVYVDTKMVTVRLYGIDCPEANQSFGDKAKQFTTTLALGKLATVYKKGVEQPGITLGWVFVDNRCLNKELLGNGLAWWRQEAAPDERELSRLHFAAKHKGEGLWGDDYPVAPWEWRKQHTDGK